MSELEGSVNYMWSNCLIIMMKKLSPREGEVCPSLPWQGLHCTVSVCPSHCYQTFKTASKTATWAVPGCLCPVATYRQGLFNEKRKDGRERTEGGIKGRKAIDSQDAISPCLTYSPGASPGSCLIRFSLSRFLLLLSPWNTGSGTRFSFSLVLKRCSLHSGGPKP